MGSAAQEFEELLRCTASFQEAGLPYMVVGALAVSVHGEPRSTHDIDIVLHLPFSRRDEVRPHVAELGRSPVEERTDPQWGKRLVTTLPSGMELEVFFTYGHPLYRREYERRVELEVEGQQIPFISPEDLILRKLVNTRLRRGEDLDDAFAVAQVQGEGLDLAYLREHCAPHRVCGLVEEIAEAIDEGDT